MRHWNSKHKDIRINQNDPITTETVTRFTQLIPESFCSLFCFLLFLGLMQP